MFQPNSVRFFKTMKIFIEEDEHKYLRRVLKRCAVEIQQQPEKLDLARELVGYLDFAATCPRSSCKRKGVCTSPYVVCRIERCVEFEAYELAPHEAAATPPPASSCQQPDHAN